MKLTIEKNELLQGIEDVSKALKGSKKEAIYKSIKIDAKKEGILLTGTNETFSIIRMIPLEFKGSEIAKLHEEGTILLNGKNLIEAVKNMPKDDVELSTMDNIVLLKSGKFQCKLNTQVTKDYPDLPKIDTTNPLTLKQPLLKQMLDQTLYACATHETRPLLKGVRISIAEGIIDLIATDSHAMSAIQMEAENKEMELPVMVIPSSPLEEVQSLLSTNKEAECTLSYSSKHVLLNMKHNLTLIYIRLLEGKYPAERSMIPIEQPISVKTKRTVLLDTLNRVAAFGSEIVEMKIQEGHVNFYASKEQEATLSDELTDAIINGDELSISFNPKKIILALKKQKYDSEDVTIELSDAMKPFTLLFGDKDSKDNIQLFSPLRVK